jgi:hypothetical protein
LAWRAWSAYEELGDGVGVLVGVLVTEVPLLPVSPSAPVGDAVALSVSVAVGFEVGVDESDPVGVGDPVGDPNGDPVGVGDPNGDPVGVGDPVGDPVGVGDVDGVGVADGDGVAQAGVGVADGDGARLGGSGSTFLPEVDAPAPASTDVVSVPLKSFVTAAQFTEGLGLAVAPALDVVAPGPRPGLRTPFGDALALFVPVPLVVGEPLPSVRAPPPPPDDCGGRRSTVLLAWMIA